MVSYLLGNKGAHMYNGNKNTCDQCKKSFQTSRGLANHICCYCKECSKTFSSIQRLQNHQCQPYFKCLNCVKTFTTEKRLDNHKCAHCKACGKIYSSYQKLEQHVCEKILTLNDKSNKNVLSEEHSSKKYKTMSGSSSSNTQGQDLVLEAIEHQQLAFHPPTQNYQKDIARKINIPVVHFHSFNSLDSLNSPTKLRKIRGDGNCYFRSISFLLSGSEEFHQVVRTAVTNHMLTLGNQMTRILPPNTTVQQYLRTSRMSCPGTWATDIEIMTTSHLLATHIYIYSKLGRTWQWQKYSGHLLDPMMNFGDRSLYIQNTNGDHYYVVENIVGTKHLQCVKPNPTCKIYDPLSRYFKTQQHLASLKKDSHDQELLLKGSEYSCNSSRTQKEKSRLRKQIYRQKLNHEQKSTENLKAQIRMYAKRLNKIFEQKEKDRLKDRNRKADDKRSKIHEIKILEKSKDKKRKSLERNSRSYERKEADKRIDRKRKYVERISRSFDEKEAAKKNVNKKQTDKRNSRSNQMTEADRRKDKRRKTDARNLRSFEIKEADKTKDKKRKTDARNLRSFEIKEADKIKDKKRKTDARNLRSFEIKEADKTKDKKRKTDERNSRSFETKEADKTKDKKRKTDYRVSLDSVKEFRKDAKEGPIYICCCCHRFMYHSSVVHFKHSAYQRTDEKLLQNCIDTNIKTQQKQWICKTCQGHLKKNKMPPQSYHGNLLQLPPMPCELKTLCDLEAQLLAQRIPFMKITSLPRGAQKGIQGPVVNVPTDLQKLSTMLPRTTSESGIISLKLKRKLQYHGHVLNQTIRPKKVEDGLNFLLKNNSLYKDVHINKLWQKQSEDETPQLWTALMPELPTISQLQETSHKDKDNNTPNTCLNLMQKHQVQSAEISDQGNDHTTESSDEEEDNAIPSVQYDTCLQHPEGKQKSLEYSIAPGEGQKPISLFKDEDAEVLAFPKLFPTGQFGYNYQRPCNLTMKKYFNARLLSDDTRFAESIPYIFFAQYLTEAKQIQQNINIALRKKKPGFLDGRNIQVRDVLDSYSLNNLISHDDGYQVLRTIRGSPSAWQNMQLDCLSKIRQLGPYTFFMTFSVAEFRWTEIIQIIAQQFGEQLSEKDIDEMNFGMKSNWLKRNPVTAARHIDYMFHKFFHGVVLGPPHPIGQVLNYDVKKEFQGRGRVHFHIALHVQGAPKLGENSDEELADFVDKYISCKLPDIEEDEDLHSLVTALQRHGHSRTCKKKHTSCRFHFPKPPSPTTLISHPPDNETDTKELKEAECILKLVYSALLEWNAAEPLSIQNLLEHTGISVRRYIDALKLSTKRHMVILKRQPSEQMINNYNPLFLTTWRANMDIQLVLDTYACVMYVTSYLCKAERTMSELLRQASKQFRKG